MTVSTTLVTLDGTAQQLAAAAGEAGGAGVSRLFVEPLRTNTHIVSVGTSAVTADGSGTGVIAELAVPGVGILDRFDMQDQNSRNTIVPTQFYVRGTSTEKVKVTTFTV